MLGHKKTQILMYINWHNSATFLVLVRSQKPRLWCCYYVLRIFEEPDALLEFVDVGEIVDLFRLNFVENNILNAKYITSERITFS